MEVHHQVPNKFRDPETSAERTIIWADQQKPKKQRERSVVPVVYYLCRDGHLEQPHFMEVPTHSSNQGLYLRDVINRLNTLRGKGMASVYSWSSKRSYRNGFVWHDLSENDFIYPVHGQEYVLKGSEIIQPSFKSRDASESTISSSSEKQQPSNSSEESSEFPAIVRRRNQSWSSVDLQEYKVYKTSSNGADASTQTTDEKRQSQRRRAIHAENQTTELSREEISPPPSSPSPETLESLIKADGRTVGIPRSLEGSSLSDIRDKSTANSYPSGRIRASAVLMQLISCGSLSIKESSGGCGPKGGKDLGLSLVSQCKARLPRGAQDQGSMGLSENENPSFGFRTGGGVQVEDKEYFSGSLIETKKDGEFPVLKRSSSYNADRSSRLELERERDAVRAKCIPRMPKSSTRKNEI